MKNLGFFNFGISFSVYYFLMFLAIPLFTELITILYDEQFKDYMNGRYFLTSQIYTYESFFFAFLGWISFIIAYLLTPSYKKIPIIIFRSEWSLYKTFFLSAFLFAMGYIVKIPRMFTDSINYEMFSDTLLTPFWGFCFSPGILHILAILIAILGFYEARQKEYALYKNFKSLLLFMIPIFILSVLLIGGKSKLIALGIFFLIVHSYYFKFRLKKIILILILITIVVFKFDELKRGIVGDITEEIPFSINFDPYVERISQIQVFTQIVLSDEEPLYGYTFNQFFEEFKPQSIRENIINENEFGRKYHIIQNTDYKTGVAMTTIGDLYINFHLTGVLIGLFLLGILYKRLFTFLQNASMFGKFAIPILWVVIIHGIESSISILLSGIIYTLFSLIIIHLTLIRMRLP